MTAGPQRERKGRRETRYVMRSGPRACREKQDAVRLPDRAAMRDPYSDS